MKSLRYKRNTRIRVGLSCQQQDEYRPIMSLATDTIALSVKAGALSQLLIDTLGKFVIWFQY